MTEPINSQIFATGTKFVVTDKTTDGSFGPGTTGFISYVKGRDQDYQTVIYYHIVTIKRGKGGKERLDINEISTPVFEIDYEDMAKILPDNKRRYYVHIKPIINPPSIMDMTNIDFIAYAFAYARWIKKLNSRAKHVNAWPNDSGHILNEFVRMDEFYSEDPSFTRIEYGGEAQRRVEFINQIRIMESTLVRCALSYIQRIAQIEQHAAKHALSCIGSKKALKATYAFYVNKANSLETLVGQHGKKWTSHITKAVSASISWS